MRKAREIKVKVREVKVQVKVKEMEIKHATEMKNVITKFKDNTDGTHMTFSYKLMDSVVRTIRNLVGTKVSRFMSAKVVRDMVDLYNNTVHTAFDNKYTPQEVQDDIELENYFIRRWTARAQVVNKWRTSSGMKDYTAGDIVLVYYPRPLQKRRRNFDTLARFIKYENAFKDNAVVEPLDKDKDKTIRDKNKGRIIIPVFYLQYVSENEKSIPKKYHNM
ncbi:hypothetical protein FACS189472_15460 [Alphaproteobacteria bacterium]|nr:hypothetical protein FACS189472_15460 [Alphaproteobacteria bacterium]